MNYLELICPLYSVSSPSKHSFFIRETGHWGSNAYIRENIHPRNSTWISKMLVWKRNSLKIWLFSIRYECQISGVYILNVIFYFKIRASNWPVIWFILAIEIASHLKKWSSLARFVIASPLCHWWGRIQCFHRTCSWENQNCFKKIRTATLRLRSIPLY